MTLYYRGIRITPPPVRSKSGKCIFLFLDQMFIAYTIENSLFKIREKFIRILPKLDWNIIQKLKTGYLTSQLQLEIERIGKALRSSLYAIGFFFFLLLNVFNQCINRQLTSFLF